jgi:Ni,Fe-hydrogenase III large subunit
VEFLREQLRSIPKGPFRVTVPALRPEHLSVSLTEGWRGEICHVAMTDDSGRFASYKVVDPSFHNWAGLAMALRNEQISDFPLCTRASTFRTAVTIFRKRDQTCSRSCAHDSTSCIGLPHAFS